MLLYLRNFNFNCKNSCETIVNVNDSEDFVIIENSSMVKTKIVDKDNCTCENNVTFEKKLHDMNDVVLRVNEGDHNFQKGMQFHPYLQKRKLGIIIYGWI